ncbi:hypothetical protein [Chryseobacterium jejuense]|uniref:Uncharacterized protein n=1 Tax=Chryseobacterium jejuense TaxID=445960 RepID=A0A2X2X9D9_CHRJE|nr:hypothetical protein [Chryseobacterium jejuense]SDI64211.1 hypothetical protein SAMN05421542_1580 [Chryseobacterium jejuense]SQB47311.1 Uncharacterised protein [Chryseobacterium jejuense]
MMKLNFNKIVFLLIIFCTVLIHAQKNTDNIDGVYKAKGAVFIINKNKTFLVIAYATLIKGTWSIEKDLLYLKPKNPEAKFYVYAHKNPDIKTGMRINFAGDGIGNSNIIIGEFPDKMQSLFNDEANCLSYPNVHVFKEKFSAITLLENLSYENGRGVDIPKLMYTFPTGDYNDFIVQHMQDSLYHNDFIFKITKKGLSDANSGSGEIIKKSTVKEEFSNEKELEFMNQSFDMAFDADYKLVNNAYNMNDDMNEKIDLNNYKYNKQKNVYVNPAVPVKELNYKSKDYHDNNVLMKFDRITGTSQAQVVVKKLPKPLFVANCDNL